MVVAKVAIKEAAAAGILIDGGGTAGWMTAAALGWAIRHLPIEVVPVESEEIGTVADANARVKAMPPYPARARAAA